ncbi:L-type lectin-domain containing receptor kinase IX.1-like [Rosa rugosa]|uniref:L-type lectin-domain containing receptor kinase IX.1-like n=1 Tax=Rosa rugosa TaxID=74645 RepID=UPI002B4156BE|nr:L-type lectin-domain containing receptor kinase IX.1-like [Rosa rugosa]
MAVINNCGNGIMTQLHEYSLKQLQFLLLLFFLLTPSATSITFNLSSFSGADSIITEQDATIDKQVLRLTNSAVDESQAQSVGRATWQEPFLLRETATGKLADFTTHFTFVIDSLRKPDYADGLVFFIAPNGSLLNTSLGGGGGALGLPVENTAGNIGYDFVAVEFDIFQNTQIFVDDPTGNHVGIDVNSLKSLNTKPWNGNITYGQHNSATVSYNSSTKNLSVAFTTFVNGTQQMDYLSDQVDLIEYLPDLVIVGFSAATGDKFAVHKILSWNFTSTNLTIPGDGVIPGNGVSVALVVGLSIGGFIILVGGLTLVWFIFWKKREGGESDDEDPMVLDDEFEKGTGPRKFSYSELARATNNFVEGEKLGEGGFGGVYRGFIKDLNTYVAVKRVSKGSKQGLKEYASEVRIISRLRHRNLVQLIGWCHEKSELLLVYEYMPNGSLDSHLFKLKSLLSWRVRYKIAQGLASGLFYLHEEWEQCVLHRDIKSSNIMLDSNFNVKLGDFGLARLVDHGKQSETTIVAGTRGYMALEYVTTGKASKESDVYSFGVVALEIACGRKPIDLTLISTQINMVQWVWELYGEGKVIEAADPVLSLDFDEKQMECLMIVGLWCAHPDYSMRPSIQQAIQVLNFEVPLPSLPPHMPMATFPPPISLSTLSGYTTSSVGGQTESSGNGYTTNSSQFTTSSATASLL